MPFDDLFDDMVPHGTAHFTLDGVFVRSTSPVILTLKHAGDTNAPLMTAQLKMVASRRKLTRDRIQAERIATARLYAKHVVAGWEHVCGTDGKALPFKSTGPDSCEELLVRVAEKLPDVWLAIVSFATDPDNFRDEPAAAAETLGK